MNRTARRRCRKAAFIVAEALVVAGVVLLLFASMQMFRLPYHTAKADGLTRPNSPVAHFLACDAKSERMAALVGGTDSSAGKGLQRIANLRCIAAQAPFVYVFVITCSMLVATAVLALVATLKRSRSALFAFPVLCAVTFALLLASVYTYLLAFKPLTQLVPCDGLTEAQARVLTKARLGVCVVTPDGDRKGTAFTLFDYMLIWAVGWFVSLVALFMLLGLVCGVVSRVLKRKGAFDDASTHTPSPSASPLDALDDVPAAVPAARPLHILTYPPPAVSDTGSTGDASSTGAGRGSVYPALPARANPFSAPAADPRYDRRTTPSGARQPLPLPDVSAQYFAPPAAQPPPLPPPPPVPTRVRSNVTTNPFDPETVR